MAKSLDGRRGRRFGLEASQGSPTLSVLCETPSVKLAFERDLSEQGFCLHRGAFVRLLLDLPRGYALRTLEEMDRTDVRMIVVTWNSCPEYLEDLRDCRPEALLSDDFFLHHSPHIAFEEVVNRVRDGGRYDHTPGLRTPLSCKERKVLRLVAEGLCNKRISEKLHVEKQTIKNRLREIYRKLGLNSRTAAALYYWQLWHPSK